MCTRVLVLSSSSFCAQNNETNNLLYSSYGGTTNPRLGQLRPHPLHTLPCARLVASVLVWVGGWMDGSACASWLVRSPTLHLRGIDGPNRVVRHETHGVAAGGQVERVVKQRERWVERAWRAQLHQVGDADNLIKAATVLVVLAIVVHVTNCSSKGGGAKEGEESSWRTPTRERQDTRITIPLCEHAARSLDDISNKGGRRATTNHHHHDYQPPPPPPPQNQYM